MASANGNNSALEKKINPAAPTSTKGLQGILDKFQSQISMALPVHLKNNAERYARQMISLHSANPYLQRCTVHSMLGALMTASALGLDLTPQLGQCYIIPYKDQAQFQLGYKGMLDLANRSGQIKRVFADVVYEKDHFEYSKGLGANLIHRESPEEDRGAPTHVYALAEFINGGYSFDVWTWNRAMSHGKKFSQSFSKGSSPWQSDPEAMAKKTLLKSIWKYLPISTDIQIMGASDETVKEINKDSITMEADVLTLPAQEEQEFQELPQGDLSESDTNGTV